MGLCCEKQSPAPLATLHRHSGPILDYPHCPKAYTQNSQITGFLNLGNTCYINSSLQCLIHTQPLREYFLSEAHLEDLNPASSLGTGGLFAWTLGKLIESYGGSSSALISKQLVELLWANGPFAPGHQSDVHEFLLFFLDKVHEDLNRSRKPLRKPRIKSRSANETKAARQWREHLMTNSSVVVDLMQGQVRSIVHCLNCNLKKIRFEQFLVLSLTIAGHKTLEKCLAEFMQPELLNSSNKWGCTRCNEKVHAQKSYNLWKLPPILIIHLKRFFYTKKGSGKICDFVKYPVEGLTLTHFLSKQHSEPAVYDLFSVIEHKGSSLNSGHYVSMARNSMTGTWNKFDDSSVTPLKESQSVVSRDSYVLFYQKRSVKNYSRQQLDRPHLWPHQLSTVNLEGRSVSSLDNSDVSEDSFVLNSGRTLSSE